MKTDVLSCHLIKMENRGRGQPGFAFHARWPRTCFEDLCMVTYMVIIIISVLRRNLCNSGHWKSFDLINSIQ